MSKYDDCHRVDSGKWEEPSEKNWFNSYIEVASLKR